MRADKVFLVGGVQAIALMANGLFGIEKSDIIVGPGNHIISGSKETNIWRGWYRFIGRSNRCSNNSR